MYWWGIRSHINQSQTIPLEPAPIKEFEMHRVYFVVNHQPPTSRDLGLIAKLSYLKLASTVKVSANYSGMGTLQTSYWSTSPKLDKAVGVFHRS
jgi:hypothetical protein